MIETPWTQVIDHGTHFSVTVDALSGQAYTHVYEGEVEVNHLASGQRLSLSKDQGNSATSTNIGSVTEGTEHAKRLTQPKSINSPDWTLLPSSKDAYLGNPEGLHVSDILLLVKEGDPARQTFIGFDLSNLAPTDIAEAELRLHFAPTGFGMASLVPDATFSVHGLSQTDIPWAGGGGPVESLSKLLEKPRQKLATFAVPRGVQSGEFIARGEALTQFLRTHAGSAVTLLVLRDTAETQTNGLVHGFASRRHPTLPAPTLAIQSPADD